MICGFPDETENDHLDTISLMNKVKYDFGFMFNTREAWHFSCKKV